MNETWSEIRPLLAPIGNPEQLAQATANLESLLSEIGEDAQHPLGDLARLMIERVTGYETAAFPTEAADGAEMLAHYMQQHGETQEALAQATGIPQSVLSRLLGRKRPFTLSHARILAAHFKTAPAVFV